MTARPQGEGRLAAGWALVLLLAAAPTAQTISVTTLEVTEGKERVGLRDMDGDGSQDLLRLDADGIGVRFLGPDGSFPDTDAVRLAWPGDEVGWDLTDFDGDGAVDLIMVLGGREIRVWELNGERTFDEGRVLLDGLKGHLPRGIRHVPFAHDVNDDDLRDIVLPGAGAYNIYLALPDGTFEEPLVVSFEASVDFDVGDPDSLVSRFGEDVEVPWFRLYDVDGDGLTDLVSETSDLVLFHLARPELPREPTWRLPIGELRQEARAARSIDLDDLLSNLDRMVTWRLFDLDGVYPDDLVLLQGGTFRIFLGGAATGPDEEPDQVLKSSGNVLHYVVRDVAGDELPELQIIRGDRISLGQAIRLLVLPGSLDIDIFTYTNNAGTFSRKPARRSTIQLEIPRLLAFMEEMEETRDDAKERMSLPARRLSLDGDGIENDVADLRDGKLLLFRDVLPAGLEESMAEQFLRSPDKAGIDGLLEAFILEDLDAMDGGDTRVIDLEDLRDVEVTPWADYRRRTKELPPNLSFTTPFKDAPPESLSLRITDVDGDGVSDIVIVGTTADEQRLVQIIVVGNGE